MERTFYLKCTSCRKELRDDERIQECPSCGGLTVIKYEKEDISTDQLPDRAKLDSSLRMWQFRNLLPVSPSERIITLGEGLTPLVWANRERNDSSTRRISALGFKLDYLNPTCSFKDRGASLLLTKATKFSAQSTVIDSSGNAAASVAAYSARAGIRCQVFVPASTSPDKLQQIHSYGAEVSKIEGTRQDVLKAAKDYAKQSPADRYYCSFQLNPFALEASSTIAYEIALQMYWNPPNFVIVPVGTGGLLIGCARGFARLKEVGWTEKIPKVIGVQPEGSSAVVGPLLTGNPIASIEHPETIAEGLKIGFPYRGGMAIEQIRSSGGTGVLVSDAEIRNATNYLCKVYGIYAEPSGAVSMAGFQKLVESEYLPSEGRVVCIITGSGLKTGKSPPLAKKGPT